MKALQRQKKLLECCANNDTYKNVESLSSILQASKRTIFNDIKVLEEKGYVFDKKPGLGIRLVDNCNLAKDDFNCYSLEYRRNQIIVDLLFNGKIITYESLSLKYQVSESSIQTDITFVKENLIDGKTVKLVSDEKGTRFEGKEEEWQRTFIRFNEFIFKQRIIQFYNPEILDVMKEYYPKEVVDICYKTIRSFKDYNLYDVADYYLLNVFNVIMVMCYRMQLGFHHDAEYKAFESDQIMSLMYYMIAKDILDLITVPLNINYYEKDIRFLLSYLNANKIIFSATKVQYGKDFEEIIREIVRRMEQCAGVYLSDDDVLYQNLSMHIVPMIYRLKNNMYITNPMLEEIKKQYRIMFDLTWLCMSSLKEKMNINLTDDEVGFLMLHFQNALEKKKSSKRILVICPNGITTSNMIANQIRRILPPLDIIEVASMDVIEKFDLGSIDFIVSTIPIKNITIPVIVVSSIMNENDLADIERVYRSKLVMPKLDTKCDKAILKDYLQSSNIFYHKGKISKEDIIKKICSNLSKDGIVSEKFECSVFEREVKGGTDIISGGAIPHGAVTLVNKTQLAMWVNIEPVKWTKYKVHVVIMFALSEKDMKNSKKILETAFSFIHSKDKVEELILAKNKKELEKIIFEGEQNGK